ncbi:uncharacterized protein METZ01_LOCUS70227 [marine metagenome]|uniref:Baseplate protein n=1 Tax=marine metagenome TaxID=408172 RepID=A0A381TTK9_9ZZZZ
MTLPVINTPTYELVVPSTKEKLTYRPFLVKEEKILLMAMEEEKDSQLNRALKQVVHNCTFEKIDVGKLPLFDLEYIFLRIRAKSVGEVAKIQVLCEDDGETYVPIEVDLESIEVEFQEDHSTKIELTDEIGIEMGYPTFEFLNFKADQTEVNQLFDIIGSSIERVYEGETVYEKADFSKKDLKVFLESLTSEQFLRVQKFFETMPRLRHKFEVTNPKTKKKNEITLEGLQAFFE